MAHSLILTTLVVKIVITLYFCCQTSHEMTSKRLWTYPLSSRKTVRIAGVAVMAALSVIMQCLPPLFLTPWWMRIDFVAVPWVLCWLLFGLDAALLSAAVSIPLVGFIGPFAGGWVGMVMKFVASVWMFVVPSLFVRKWGLERFLSSKSLLAASGALAVLVRGVVCVLFNLYFAIPVFFGMTPKEVIQFFTNPRFQSFLARSLGLIGFTAYFAEVVFWNTVQGVIDLYVSLALAAVIVRKL